MENKDEAIATEIKENKEVVQVDYDQINKHINSQVETEIGKFIKNFMENNKPIINTNSEATEIENDTERELKEWKI